MGTPKSFRAEVEEVQEVQEGPNKLEEKLSIIQIPGVQFFSTPLEEVAAELMRLAKQFDLTEGDPTKKGLNIIVLGEDKPQVTITLNAMTIRSMIQFITESIDWTFDEDQMRLLLQKQAVPLRDDPWKRNFMKSPKEPLIV